MQTADSDFISSVLGVSICGQTLKRFGAAVRAVHGTAL